MSYWYRCERKGRSRLVETPGLHRCAFCGGMHLAEESSGEGPIGMPYAPPPFKRHYSFVHGRQLNSWGDYHQANKELNLIDTGEKPDKTGQWATGRSVSFAGQTRRSIAEQKQDAIPSEAIKPSRRHHGQGS